jgi:hypothetical protein
MSYFLNNRAGKLIPVGLSMRIGSDPSCDIVVKDPDVSGVHAVIGCFPDGLLIRDEDSTSGTFINGEKIEHVIALVSGDRIRVGGTEFYVEYEAEKTGSDKPPDTIDPLRKLNSPANRASQSTVRPIPPVDNNFSSVTLQPAHPEPVSSQTDKKQKPGGGCLRIGLTIILIMLLACVVLGGGGYLLVKNGVIPKRMIDVMLMNSQSQVHFYNFTDKEIFIQVKEDVDEGTMTIPFIYMTLKPYESYSKLSYAGTGDWNNLDIGTTKDAFDLGQCRFFPDQAYDYNIIILSDKVLIDDVRYPQSMDKLPAKGRDLIMVTSPLCKPRNQSKGGG